MVPSWRLILDRKEEIPGIVQQNRRGNETMEMRGDEGDILVGDFFEKMVFQPPRGASLVFSEDNNIRR